MTVRYRTPRGNDQRLRGLLRELAQKRRRFGVRRLAVMLRRLGERVTVKRGGRSSGRQARHIGNSEAADGGGLHRGQGAATLSMTRSGQVLCAWPLAEKHLDPLRAYARRLARRANA